tara:strand:+ start:210 stop:455 length:246 start_codon:yes stop_codon:yes gene_type:complete
MLCPEDIAHILESLEKLRPCNKRCSTISAEIIRLHNFIEEKGNDPDWEPVGHSSSSSEEEEEGEPEEHIIDRTDPNFISIK